MCSPIFGRKVVFVAFMWEIKKKAALGKAAIK